MDISSQTRVGELVTRHPSTARIFERVGVDYCCGGQATLAEACQRAGVSLDELLPLLAPGDEPADNPARLSTGALIDHILETHHAFTTSEVERAGRLMRKVLTAHGQRHPELAEIAQLVEDISQELLVHMQKEERLLFPYLRGLEEAARASRTAARPPFQSAINPIRVMHHEHEAVGILLKNLRQATHEYTPPADGCPTYRALFDSLASLERDVHQHVHLENNVLFPRAEPLERAAFARP